MNANHPNYAEALSFVQEAGTMKGYLDTIDVTYQQILDRIRQINGVNGDNAAIAFRDMLRRELDKEMNGLEQILASVYAERFSVDEIRQLKDFFKTGVGQKLIMGTTAIAQDFAGKSLDFQQKMATVIMPRIQMEFKMQGYQM